MSVVEVFCHRCKAIHPHASNGELIVCTGCGLQRNVNEELLIAALTVAELPVEDIRYCDWEDAWLPADHPCAGDSRPDPDHPA